MDSVDILRPLQALARASDLPYRLPGDAYTAGSTQHNGDLGACLPAGFPSQVQGLATWTGSDLENDPRAWIVQLAPEEADAIEHAVKAFQDSKLPLQQIAANTFPLSESLTQKLNQISEKCYNGRGFCILRGLKDQDRSEEAKAILFAGVSAHIASARGFQDTDRKHVLAHLFRKYPEKAGDYVPPSFNNAELSFHTDDGDIVALYYASVAAEGGRTLLASGNHVYNAIAATRPQLLDVLAKDWAIDTYYGNRDVPARRLPLLHRHGDDGITLQFTRLPFSCYDGSRARKDDIPALTEKQIEALDALQVASADSGFAVPTQPGDILYFNNVHIFHAREPYVESGTASTLPERMDRHVLRLWLRDPNRTTPLAAPLQKIWDEIYGPNTEHGREEIWNTKAEAAFSMNQDKNG